MDACIIIPARYASTRYPGKPLVGLRGASGRVRSLLERSVAAAKATGLPVFVATDDDRIEAEAGRIGVDCIRTSQECRNGTERVAEAMNNAGLSADFVVNLQGDAPLIPPHFVAALVDALVADPGCAMATPALRCTPDAVTHLLADRAAGRVGGTTVVSDRAGHALYFSKEVLPFTGGARAQGRDAPVFQHVGLYAFRPAALGAYTKWDVGVLEALEGLEQLRFLENGVPVRVVEVDAPGAVFWELNNPTDVPLIESALARLSID